MSRLQLVFSLLQVICVFPVSGLSHGQYQLGYISPISIPSPDYKPSLQTRIYGHFNRELYKELKRRIIANTETPEQRQIRIAKEERSKRDGLLYAPKTSYEIYIAHENRPPEEIKKKFRHIIIKLKQIGAENTNVYYCGLKKLVRPIKKKYEACFIIFELSVYPSLIETIKRKLQDETHVLRVLVLRDIIYDKQRRVYRDDKLHVRHSYFNSDVYKPLMHKLTESSAQTGSDAIVYDVQH